MGQPRRMRDLLGVLKDKVSIIKTVLLLSPKPTTFHKAVLEATNHHPTDPPPEHTLNTVLSLGHHHRLTVVDTILCRLQHTHSAFVAIKCLLTLHHILRRGSPLLKDQISTAGIHLNISTFCDESDSDTLELSKWARWYAEVIQKTLIVSRGERISELNSLVGMIEQICRAPESLHYQRISMVYEVMKLVGEDYRITLREISSRVAQFGGERKNVDELSDVGIEKLLDDLKRLEECKEKAFLMFLNKKRSDGTWDSIAQLRMDVQAVKQRRESQRLVTFQGTGSTPLGGLQVAESRSSVPRGKRWLDVEWNPYTLHGGIGPR